MNYASIIERVYDHLENDHVEKAVMACLRLARNTQDYLNATVFLRELYADKQQTRSVFYEDTVRLNDEAKKFLWQRGLDIWLPGRTLPYSLDPENEGENVLALGAGELDSEIVQLERSIQDMAIPPGMGEFDTAAFTDRYNARKATMRLRINAIQTVRQRIKTRCLNYAIGLEKQLQAQQKTELFLQKVQTEVNNYFKARCEDVYPKLHKAAQLVDSNDPEDYSALLGHIRRAMKAVADHFYPPVPQPAVCADGTERKLGDEQYLNRLQEFLAREFPAASSTELLRAELALLVAFARKLNDISSNERERRRSQARVAGALHVSVQPHLQTANQRRQGSRGTADVPGLKIPFCSLLLHKEHDTARPLLPHGPVKICPKRTHILLRL